MVYKLSSFFSSLSPSGLRSFEFAGHSLRFGNTFRLRAFYATNQQNINGRSGSRVINATSRPYMNTHLGNAFPDRFAIAETSKSRTPNARQDSGLCLLVG